MVFILRNMKWAKSGIFHSRLGMCVEKTASVRYLQYDASKAVLYYVSHSSKNVQSGWMSGWMKRDGVLSSFHFNVFRNSV